MLPLAAKMNLPVSYASKIYRCVMLRISMGCLYQAVPLNVVLLTTTLPRTANGRLGGQRRGVIPLPALPLKGP